MGIFPPDYYHAFGNRLPMPDSAMTLAQQGCCPVEMNSVQNPESRILVKYCLEPSRGEVASGIGALVAWAMVFSMGVIFPSAFFSRALTEPLTTKSLLMAPLNLTLFIMTYTVSNAAVLCLISGWLGELGRRSRITGDLEPVPCMRGDYVAALIRAFLSYLGILTGFVVVGTGINILTAPTPETYVRLAAIVSLSGFVFGSNRPLFRHVSDRIIKGLNGGKSDSEKGDQVIAQVVKECGAEAKVSGTSNGFVTEKM